MRRALDNSLSIIERLGGLVPIDPLPVDRLLVSVSMLAKLLMLAVERRVREGCGCEWQIFPLGGGEISM